ncbi:MBL fold metallo-hydrolase [Pedobacter sp. AW1-32]|uniref:MBL fold metallo-hydrolase n=1 Tax=Pedobacter sp. AW1-32 TaxID=3383026 RepID=UPI003FF15698
MKITALHQGIFTVDKQKNFVRRTAGSGAQQNTLTMGISPFLIEIHNEVILLDTGLALLENNEPLLYNQLADLGLQKGDVTKILLSHLHKDHIGGIGQVENQQLILNFPSAKIYLQRREMDFALQQKGNPSYILPLLEALSASENVEFMEDDEGSISDEIRFEVTGGHSPFHQAFWITKNAETAFYGADDLPQVGYLKYHIAYKTDFDGKKALAMRNKWQREALESDWTVLFYHNLGESILKLTR